MYITITLVMMRKMMSILFLVLVLIISLGLGQLTYISEGMEAADPNIEETPDTDTLLEDEEVDKEDVPEVNADLVPDPENPTFDVAPMDGTSTESMSNYR